MSRNGFIFVLLGVLTPSALWAFSAGAGLGYAGAPGDFGNCTACHSGTALNAGGGGVAIILPGAAAYSPGSRQTISIYITDPVAKRWGFEFTARLDSNPTTGQAGTLGSTSNSTQLICRTQPCTTTAAIQYLTQTAVGTETGATGGVVYTFDWYAPQTDVGSVTFYVTALAANGNGSVTGDHTYAASVQLIEPRPWPVIGNVTNLATGAPGTAAANWIAITGSLLSNSTRTWTPAEAAAGLPTSLDGVSVQVNNSPAFVQSISPTKIVALTPSDTSLGPVDVWVTNNSVTGVPFRAEMYTLLPGLLTGPDNHHVLMSLGGDPLASRLDNIPSVVPATPAAFPGQAVSFYGIGFGPVNPAISDGVLQAAPASIATPFTLTIGGEAAVVTYAGLALGFAAVYQFNTTIPYDLPPGDQAVVIRIGGVSTQSGAVVAVQAAPPAPVIASVVSAAANSIAGTAPASWIAINGTNLAATTRTWTAAEATAATGLPSSLDGVSVLVNNLPAFVQAVSPTQLIVLTLSDTTVGQINVQVTNNGKASAPSTAAMASLAPALFTADGTYLVTTHGTAALDTRLDVYPSSPAWPMVTWPAPVPAQPGETISFYGTAFGATDVPIVDGQLQVTAANVITAYIFTIGGEPVVPSFAGLAPGFAGLFQFTVAIPADLPNADQPVVITMGGLSTVQSSSCCFVTVQAASPSTSLKTGAR